MSTATCEWFALCDRLAAGVVRHPFLGDVPCCQRCADKLDLTLELTPKETDMEDQEHVWCPYPDCGVEGTEEEVNAHRAEAVATGGAHHDQEQAGSNLRHKPRS